MLGGRLYVKGGDRRRSRFLVLGIVGHSVARSYTATESGANQTDGATSGRAVGRSLRARWRQEQELAADATAWGWEREQERHTGATSCSKATGGRTGRATHRARIPEDDVPSGLEPLPSPRLVWGRTSTNILRSSVPVFGVHFGSRPPLRPRIRPICPVPAPGRPSTC